MFILKKNRRQVYEALFNDGVFVVKKDFYSTYILNPDAAEAEQIKIPNLQVMGLLKSLKSKKYVDETFNWQFYYYYLTNEGIEYLRQYLALPADIQPNTCRKNTTGLKPGSIDEKRSKAGPGGDFNPEFKKEGYRGKSEYRA